MADGIRRAGFRLDAADRRFLVKGNLIGPADHINLLRAVAECRHAVADEVNIDKLSVQSNRIGAEEKFIRAERPVPQFFLFRASFQLHRIQPGDVAPVLHGLRESDFPQGHGIAPGYGIAGLYGRLNVFQRILPGIAEDALHAAPFQIFDDSFHFYFVGLSDEFVHSIPLFRYRTGCPVCSEPEGCRALPDCFLISFPCRREPLPHRRHRSGLLRLPERLPFPPGYECLPPP